MSLRGALFAEAAFTAQKPPERNTMTKAGKWTKRMQRTDAAKVVSGIARRAECRYSCCFSLDTALQPNPFAR
jgi:hypothetical protein